MTILPALKKSANQVSRASSKISLLLPSGAYSLLLTAHSFLFRVKAHYGPRAPAIARRCCPPLPALPLIIANHSALAAHRRFHTPFIIVPQCLFFTLRPFISSFMHSIISIFCMYILKGNIYIVYNNTKLHLFAYQKQHACINKNVCVC